MADYVIDASSMLAYAFAEPGAEIVLGVAADESSRLLVSSVNMAEVLAKFRDKGIDPKASAEILAPLDLAEIAFDQAQSRISADLRDATRRFGLSLGDRSCLALGKYRAARILTADRSWIELAGQIGLDILLTRA